ncbi:sensor histidine kinase YfiJ [Arthrobacter sp. Hiyo4]|nr:sensor histidine kinase YfiJ [Arthrobacter sp. Hiyo4]
MQQTASENLAEVRSFVRGLSSLQLQESSLPESLQRLCGETETLAAARGDGLRCRFELVGDPAELPPQYSVTLLRAAQASLANVRLHAKASTAVVTLAFLGDEVTLDVYDDGTGFVPEAPGSGVAGRADGSGFGLRSLAARVADYPVVRAGLRAMLTEFADFSVAAEAADGDAALRELARLRTLGAAWMWC